MSYNPLPQPADVVVISAGSSVTEVNRFPVGIGTTGSVSLNYSNKPITFNNPLPVSLGSSSITINGNVNVGTTVSVTSSPENPVHNHLTEVGTSGILTVPYLPVGIGTNNLNLTYLPVGISSLLNTVSIANTVSISNTSFYVTGVGGSVSVANTGFYVLNPVTSVTVGGTVSIGNTVSISNTSFYITNPVTSVTVGGTVSIANTVSISNTSFYITNPVTSVTVGGTVSIANTVSISNTSFYVLNPVTSVTVGGTVSIANTVSVTSSPQNPNHIHLTEVGTSGILTTPYLPVGISTFNNIIVVKQPEGSLYSFNNHATNTNRGWTMDDTMRPVMSIRVNSSGTTISDLAEITEYEIGNNNANQSTIIYEWYEGDINIAGAAIPAWNSLGTKLQYRVYQDKYSSNAGNTFTQNSSVMRHSGVIIGKNTSGDEGPSTMNGGASPNMLTLCMRRVDNSTKLDVWFAFTCKELS